MPQLLNSRLALRPASVLTRLPAPAHGYTAGSPTRPCCRADIFNLSSQLGCHQMRRNFSSRRRCPPPTGQSYSGTELPPPHPCVTCFAAGGLAVLGNGAKLRFWPPLISLFSFP